MLPMSIFSPSVRRWISPGATVLAEYSLVSPSFSHVCCSHIHVLFSKVIFSVEEHQLISFFFFPTVGFYHDKGENKIRRRVQDWKREKRNEFRAIFRPVWVFPSHTLTLLRVVVVQIGGCYKGWVLIRLEYWEFLSAWVSADEIYPGFSCGCHGFLLCFGQLKSSKYLEGVKDLQPFITHSFFLCCGRWAWVHSQFNWFFLTGSN